MRERVPPDQTDRQRDYRRRHQAPPPPLVEAHPPTSVLAGRGIFTVERPEDAAGLKCYTIRAAGQDTWTANGAIIRQAETATEYANALKWGYGGMTEGALVTNLDPSFLPPGGGWPVGWTMMPEAYWNVDGGLPGLGRSVPNMLFQAHQVLGAQWGSVPIVPVIGCYDGSGETPGVGVRLTVTDYLPDLKWAMDSYPFVVGYAIWRVETLSAADIEALT